MTRLFRRRSKPPLQQAQSLVQEAIDIAYRYLRDTQHTPTSQELEALAQLTQSLLEQHHTACYIHRCLQQRANGEPEGARFQTSRKAFDYRWPP